MKKNISKNNYYLGINLYQDPSAAIVRNGKVLFFCEEERLIRVKHAKNYYPIKSINECLKKANIEFDQLSAISINWDIPKYTNGTIAKFYQNINKYYKVDINTKKWQKNNLKINLKKNYENFHINNLNKHFNINKKIKFQYFSHHFIHAFQACFQSNFKKAICLSLDGSGDTSCSTVWKYENSSLTKIKDIKIPHSLGWFYAAITEFLGFEAYDGEYKVMGLASYGKYDKNIYKKLKKIVSWSEKTGDYKINPYFIHFGEHSYSNRFTDRLCELLQMKPQNEKSLLSQKYKDLAYNAQLILENCSQNIVNWAVNKTKIKNICISGGVGLNVKNNSKIFTMKNVNNVFAHPLCMDSGAAAGAALYSSYKFAGSKPEKIFSLSLGPSYRYTEIEEILINKKINYEYFKSKKILHEFIAKEMSKDKIFGYFNGSMEGGPRALGNRSIIGNPSKISMRNKINKIVKYREIWRPLCPSILPELKDKYLHKNTFAPFMIIAFEARDKFKKIAPAVVHVDNTSRVQITTKNSDFYKLIKAFYKQTGIGAILNTSFNLKGEPVVCSPADAIKTFYSSGLDYLVLNNFLIKK